jgi:hypothetical protein
VYIISLAVVINVSFILLPWLFLDSIHQVVESSFDLHK